MRWAISVWRSNVSLSSARARKNVKMASYTVEKIRGTAEAGEFGTSQYAR